MMKHIAYPKIGQFRNVLKPIISQLSFTGMVDGKPTYGPIKDPIVPFRGTVKIHGTNAGVAYNAEDGMWFQSRKNVITVENDNAGFAFFCSSRTKELQRLINYVYKYEGINPYEHTVTLYGEWAGKGIQKSVGIAEVPKKLFLFGAKISNIKDPEIPSYWSDFRDDLRDHAVDIYNVIDFACFNINIDVTNPQKSTNALAKITNEIENQCPVAKFFGVEGTGEGIVWEAVVNGTVHRFKVKGEKHSVSKVKTLSPVNVEKIASIDKFVDYASTDNRFNQALGEVFGGADPDIKAMGDLIRWVIKDIIEEELDVLTENGLEPKDVNRAIAADVRGKFMQLTEV